MTMLMTIAYGQLLMLMTYGQLLLCMGQHTPRSAASTPPPVTGNSSWATINSMHWAAV